MPLVPRLEVSNVVTLVNIGQGNSAKLQSVLLLNQLGSFMQGEVLPVLQGVDVGDPVLLYLCQPFVFSSAVPCIGEVVNHASSQLVVADNPYHSTVDYTHLS